MYFNFKNLVLLFLLATVLSVSCKKQNTSIDYNPAITASNEFAANQQMMTQILNTYFKSLTDSTLWADSYAIIDGAAVNIIYSPKLKMVINYESWGNNDGYGHFRIGSIEAVPEINFIQPDAQVNFNFINFLYDKDTLLVNKMNVTYVGEEAQSIKKYAVLVDSAVLIYSDTTDLQRYSFNMNQIFRLKKDPASIYTSELDEIFITGTMDGITNVLNTYNAVVADTSEIVDKYTCPYLSGGPISLQVAGFIYPASIIYPEPGVCYNQYEIIVDGNPFPFPFDYSE